MSSVPLRNSPLYPRSSLLALGWVSERCDPRVPLSYVDDGYAGRFVAWAKDKAHIVLEVGQGWFRLTLNEFDTPEVPVWPRGVGDALHRGCTADPSPRWTTGRWQSRQRH